MDGLRGLAALWVLTGHCTLLTGFSLPVLGNADLGVDLFILLSGFLMVYQYQLRSSREDWRNFRTWRAFWTRRFFRLSPLYFLLLAIALAIGPKLFEHRQVIDHFFSRSPQLSSRYEDRSLSNVIAHLTYLFGLLPAYAFRTPLPDWSIGLEMQFYLVFPLLVIAALRFGWLTTAGTAFVIGAALTGFISLAGVQYPMPTFLPMKLNLFLAGMLIAADPKDDASRLLRQLALSLAFTAISVVSDRGVFHFFARELLVIGLFVLVRGRSISIIDTAARFLGSKAMHWLGELSYGTYLIHLLIMQPLASLIITQFGTGIPDSERFLLVFFATAIITYALAYIGYRLVECPGQKIGRLLTS